MKLAKDADVGAVIMASSALVLLAVMAIVWAIGGHLALGTFLVAAGVVALAVFAVACALLVILSIDWGDDE